MRKIILITLLVIAQIISKAQQKDFEGTAVYKIDVKSKTPGVSDRVWKGMIAYGDEMTVVMKQGNSKQTSGPSEIYSITKDQKVYMKFKGIDTLYYLDYNSDTSSVLEVLKPDEKKKIAGLDCKAITIKTPSSTKKYFYSPTVYVNPDYDKNNTIGRYDVFARETSSLYLGLSDDNESYSISQTCTSLQQQAVNNNEFELPKLPQKIFTMGAISQQPRFKGTGGFIKYLELNLDATVGAKYLRLPKGEESVTQTVMVLFMINENGRVTNVSAANKDEVHPKLAAEAIRVVSASPPWIPASVLGEKIIFWYKQPVTFVASKR
ncbi:MAG TPA: energy transducer TonB [Chitinophagaceae bacterium]|nr:energy transducer TonB [Chitinophagaceae bacterium]